MPVDSASCRKPDAATSAVSARRSVGRRSLEPRGWGDGISIPSDSVRGARGSATGGVPVINPACPERRRPDEPEVSGTGARYGRKRVSHPSSDGDTGGTSLRCVATTNVARWLRFWRQGPMSITGPVSARLRFAAALRLGGLIHAWIEAPVPQNPGSATRGVTYDSGV